MTQKNRIIIAAGLLLIVGALAVARAARAYAPRNAAGNSPFGNGDFITAEAVVVGGGSTVTAFAPMSEWGGDLTVSVQAVCQGRLTANAGSGAAYGDSFVTTSLGMAKIVSGTATAPGGQPITIGQVADTSMSSAAAATISFSGNDLNVTCAAPRSLNGSPSVDILVSVKLYTN
jgi:hypothetical protein